MSRALKKSERLNQILRLLLDHPEGLAVRELRQRLGFHRSTIHRDLEDLAREYPVYNLDGRWYVDREAVRFQVPLNLHEAMALYLAVRMMATRTDKHNPHAAAALRHLARALTMFDLPAAWARYLRLEADAPILVPFRCPASRVCPCHWATRSGPFAVHLGHHAALRRGAQAPCVPRRCRRDARPCR